MKDSGVLRGYIECINYENLFDCDPNATEFKLQLMRVVKGKGHEVADLGSEGLIYANTKIGIDVTPRENDSGIIACGTGLAVLSIAVATDWQNCSIQGK